MLRLLIFLLLFPLLTDCSESNEQAPRKMAKGITVQPIDNDNALIDTLHQFDEVYVFLSADWCYGGKLTFHNAVFPFLDELRERNIPLVVGYIGNIEAYEFSSLESDHPFIIHHLEDSWPDMGYFDKKRLSGIVEELDEAYKFQNKVPLCLLLRKGKVVSEMNLGKLLEENDF